MKYENVAFGEFLERPNRFVARVRLGGEIETVHVKNTGRCRELLVPGAPVVLAPGAGAARKTRFDLVCVEKPGLGWVNIDSQAPNVLVAEYIKQRPAPFGDVTLVRPEYAFGRSRVDFYLERPGGRCLLEVKGCTLEREGVGFFPDAPTERGAKHLRELAAAVGGGWECFVAFVVTMNGVTQVLPNAGTDPAFARALSEARDAGVRVLTLPCSVGPDRAEIIGCL